MMYGIDKITDDIERDANLRKRVVNIRQQLYGKAAVV